MAKREIVWSNTAIKKLFAIFEADIRKNNGKEYSVALFKTIAENLKLLVKHPLAGTRTSDESVRVLIIETIIIYYGLSADRIYIFTISEFSKNTDI
jgi:plasmid stabilization system protein ParE